MTLEFIGHVGSRAGSDALPGEGPVVDKAYIRSMAHAAEGAGLDRLLIGSFSTMPDNNQIAAYVLHNTTRLGVMLAHRTGFVSPTMAARQLATLDQLSDGRLGVHIISGGSDDDQQRDGDFLDHDQRYARTDEYLDVVKKVWTGDKPFDHEGAHYRFRGAFSVVTPVRAPGVPIYFGGSSDAAIEVAGKHADVYALWGEPLADTADTIRRVRAAAARHGREGQVRFVLAFRPVVAATEDAAWARTRTILEAVKRYDRGASRGHGPHTGNKGLPTNVGSVRLRDAAARGAVLDERLWTEVAAVTGAHGNSTALVGTPQQVADALLKYHALGVTSFLVRCFDPIPDTVSFGREVAPRVRDAIARLPQGEPALS